MSKDLWTEVDGYLEQHFTAGDSAIEAALAHQHASGLPDIAVSPTQGKLLAVLAKSAGAKRAVEFGTLGGYSTIWIARALPEDGRIVTFELKQEHADVARENFEAAGVSEKVEIRVGPAADNLGTLDNDEPFDLIFIDADKPSNTLYYEAAMKRSKPGALVIVDNVVRDGDVADASSSDPSVLGAQQVIEHVASDARVLATVIQTVGRKKHDGLLIATVL